MAVVENGKVLPVYRHLKFPKIGLQPRDEVLRGSTYWKMIKSPAKLRIAEVQAGQRLETEWGKPLPELYEQVIPQRMGFA